MGYAKGLNNMEKSNLYTAAGERPSFSDAATVIITRETEAGGFEVFLMRRHRKQAFMAGAFVYPGGRLEGADCDPALAAHAGGLTPEAARLNLGEPDTDPFTALGLYFAAVRETFEESGVLLAERGAGESATGSGGDENLLSGYRREVHQGRLTLLELAQKEDLVYSLGRLRPYAHWITPEIESRRFDTRFFLAALPANQRPVHDSIEMTESLWLTPDQALARNRDGQLLLMPPTLITLQEMARFASAKALVEAAADRDLSPILPQVFKGKGVIGLKLPYDPEYSIPEYKQTPATGVPSRLVLKESGWESRLFDEGWD